MKKMIILFFASISLISYSDIKKRCIASFSIQRSFSKEIISARSYVQDGLVLILDGIENAGWEQHDENAQYWKNLIDGEEYAVGSRIFRENGLEWINTSTLTLKPTAILGEAFFLSNKTVEFVGDSSATTHDNLGLKGQTFIGFFQNQYGTSPNRYYNTNVACYNVYAWIFFNYQYEHDGVFQDEKHRSALVIEDSYVQPYYEGQTKQYNRKLTIPDYASGFTSFIWAGRIGCVCHCIRIYNRALNAQEIKHNYLIDKIRFGL